MAGFRLEKWYLDLTDENGNAFIGYAARLKWKLIKLSYSGFTFLDSKRKVKQKNSFTVSAFPVKADGQVVWETKICSGTWKSASDALSETLLSTADGEIKWHCHFPKSTGTVQVDGAAISGSGYVEFIELTILPWKLPIHQLHWGRFIAETDVIVWIRWIGPVPKTIIFHNGERITNAEIQQQRLTFGNFMLELKDSIPMRKGSLMKTVFSRFPSVAKLFPKTILQLQENKWCSGGELFRSNKKVASGKAIHEVVEWR